MTAPIRIVKMGYSAGPWRLVSGESQLTTLQTIDHSMLGTTSVVMPMCFDTKTEAVEGLGALVAQLIDERAALIERLRS